MKLFQQTCLAAFALLLPVSVQAADVKVKVTNEQKTQRQELVEIDAKTVYQKLGIAEGQKIIVKNAMRQQVAYQITYDGKLLIDAAVKPCGTTVFTITPGEPEPMRSWVEGKMYPLRKDDIAWENDRGAYRVYGPQLQKTGERSFGIDVWTKNSPDLNVPERYYKDYEGNVRGYEIGKNGRKDEWIDLHTSFHLDHGKGLDCYGVGPSLGCRTPALMDGDNLIFPYCYKKYRIVDNGPLRFTVELTYNPVKIKNDENVVEHRIISLDKGSNFNKMTVWYDGLTTPTDFATGFPIHEEDTETKTFAKDYVSYADPTDNIEVNNSQVYVGVLFPEGIDHTYYQLFDKKHDGATGHALGLKRGLKNGEKYSYYFGAAWSKYDVRSYAEWQIRIKDYLDALKNPLLIEVK